MTYSQLIEHRCCWNVEKIKKLYQVRVCIMLVVVPMNLRLHVTPLFCWACARRYEDTLWPHFSQSTSPPPRSPHYSRTVVSHLFSA